MEMLEHCQPARRRNERSLAHHYNTVRFQRHPVPLCIEILELPPRRCRPSVPKASHNVAVEKFCLLDFGELTVGKNQQEVWHCRLDQEGHDENDGRDNQHEERLYLLGVVCRSCTLLVVSSNVEALPK